MTIDIIDLISKKISKKDLNLVFEEQSFQDSGEQVDFLKSVNLNGTLSLVGDIIILVGNLTTELKLNCSRCLESFSYPIDIHITEKYTNNPENKDDEIIFIDSDILDITETIQNNIIMSLPIKKLCKDDCKGLCQHCGSNLNMETCNCEKKDIDPRFSKLRDLLSSD